MSGLRKPVVMGFVLLICTTTCHSEERALSAAPTVAKNNQSLLRRIADIVKHVEESYDENGADAASQWTSRMESRVEPKHLRNLKTDSSDQIIEIFPRDLRKKEKFLKHLTGPLYFSPKCRKHVYRLYHNTRDCTIPAYFKRCARLLTRLAESPRCAEG
ncbi:ALK and LTK ligand 2 [Esox lucius]|uniref:ALK and LTK ligand 2a n=1 Tax=Esox lucius TaxID=8010 RepID=A0AAY5K7J2_ESOLU|nr:ALK and LTK ligand 2 [Esox lucius]XP_034143833.1 ALK and LTK ligand 2 [Esox lucius]